MRLRVSPSGAPVDVAPSLSLVAFAPGDVEGAGWTSSGGALRLDAAGATRFLPLSCVGGSVVGLQARAVGLAQPARLELLRQELPVGAAPSGWVVVESLAIPVSSVVALASSSFRHALEAGQVWALRLVGGSLAGGQVLSLGVVTEAA